MKSQKVKAVLLCATLCGLITSAIADHYWWVDGDALDFSWGNKDNWMLQETGDPGPPDDQASYCLFYASILPR